ncbi:MAG: hypothetical protein QM765_20925 [Myxococcales bacterium]
MKTADCTPRRSAINDSEWQTVAHSQFEQGSTTWQSMCGNGSPAIVTPNSSQCVKSVCMASPGRCSWAKKTSFSGPSLARHSCTRRCSVRSWPGW